MVARSTRQVTAAGAGLLALIAIAFAAWRSRVAAVRSEQDKAQAQLSEPAAINTCDETVPPGGEDGTA